MIAAPCASLPNRIPGVIVDGNRCADVAPAPFGASGRNPIPHFETEVIGAPISYSPTLEKAAAPQVETIIAAAGRLAWGRV